MQSSAFRMKATIHKDATNYRGIDGFGCSAMLTRYGGGIMLCTIVPHSDRGAPLFDEAYELQEPAEGFLVALARAFGLPPIEQA